MRVLILGLGQYPQGSGVASAIFFAEQGHDVTVTDLKDAEALKGNVQRLRKYKNVRFVLGRHDVDDVKKAELIVRNPRVRNDAPEIKEAIKRRIPIESDISLFLERCPALVVGVTGTRGKSTTSTLIYEMFKAHAEGIAAGPVAAVSQKVLAGAARLLGALPLHHPPRRVWLGGNILVSPLTFLSKVKKDDVVVLELSSWQLEATGFRGISPSVAVWTNLMADHLNTYSGMEEYAEAKAQIFRHQQPDDVVFLPADKSFDAFAESAPGRVIRFGKKGKEVAIVKSVKMKLLGEHNVRNAEAAVAVALAMGVAVATIKNVLRTFAGLPNRQEVVAVKKGVRYINDTTATTPDATIAALRALSNKKGSVHLIFGGADKELVFTEVAKEMKKTQSMVYLLPGTAHEKIISALKKSNVPFDDVADLAEAMRVILQKTQKGDVVLLSPGCASFGLFMNEFDRGETFKKLVKKL